MCAVLKELRHKKLPSLGGECPLGQERVNPCHSNKTTKPCHCEEVTGVTDEAIQLMLHKYNNFAQKKIVNKKLDRHGLIALAMTERTLFPSLGEQPLFLPLSGEVRRGVNSFTQSLNHLLTCSLPERRYVW